MWDIVVITTADEAQRQAFEQQIRDKHDRHELPLHLPIYVVADPPGPRIGNGGSTLTALEFLHGEYGDALYQHKVLLIHAGGWSQRMPSATILGKIFAAIPHGEPVFQMLDLKLAMYRPFVPRLSPGVFLVCADDFLVYDLGSDDDWSIPSAGFTAFCQPSPISLGRKHGVYVVDQAEKLDPKKSAAMAKCREVLQKPSDDRMKSRGALLQSDAGCLEFADGIRIEGEVVYTDNSFYFGVDVMKKLLQLKKEIGTVSCEIDAYGDFLQALGPNATDEYIFNTSNISQITSDLTRVRKQVFNAMHGFDIHLLVLNACKFIHIGTTKELIHHFSQDPEFRSQMALQKDVFNCWQQDQEPEEQKKQEENCNNHSGLEQRSGRLQGCVMHSILMSSSSVAEASVVEYCRFDVPIAVGHNSIVSNCQWLPSEGHGTEALVLPSETFLHTVSILHQGASCYVTIFFNVSDNLKASVPASSLPSLPFLTTTLGSVLKQWQLPQDVVWPPARASSASVSLWTLKLYPGASSMTQSLQLALDRIRCLQDRCTLSTALGPDSQSFFSLSDVLAQKDVATMLNFRRQLFHHIRSNRS